MFALLLFSLLASVGGAVFVSRASGLELSMPYVPALSMALIFASATPAQPNEAALALAARKFLKKHCLSCHAGEGSPSGEAFDVRDPADLLKQKGTEDKPILAAKSLDSRLWVRTGVEKSMPPKSVKERPTAEELDTLKKWIEAGAPAFPTPKQRPFVTHQALVKTVFDHLLATDSADRPYLRYFTFANLTNNAAVEDDDLRLAKAALSKAVNSLSRGPQIKRPTPVDKDETVFVVDLRHYEWHTHRLWDAVLKEYPYGLDFKGSDDPALLTLQKNLDGLTKGELMYIRADWFVATATRPPLYYTLLQLPRTAHELRASLRVDVAANFRADTLKRAGFQTSGVSGQNRLVERHDSPVGAYYWESYDFKPRKAKASIVRFPLGPEFTGNEFARQAFAHDGGEMIFGLPNGLQGYYLADGKGTRIDAGPIEVVSDVLKTAGTPAIVNGTSCMHCHKHGTIGFADTIRDGNGVFGDAREKVRRLYPEKKEMDELLKADAERFVAALDKTVGPFLKVEEDKDRPVRDFAEPVGDRTRAYLLTDVTLTMAAYELGIDKPETLAGMIRGNQKLKEIGLLPLASGKVLKRDDWEALDGTSLFQDVALALGIGTPKR